MLNHVFIKLIAMGTPAWRANLLSALADVMCAACIFLSVSLLGSARGEKGEGNGPIAAACTAAMLFAFSPLTWQYAVTAEVFALNNALMSLLVYLTLAFAMAPTRSIRLSYAYWGAFVCGLALCNQHTAVLFEVPLIAYVAWGLRRELATSPGRLIPALGLSFGAGLSPYAYLPMAAILSPKQGSWGDVTTLKGFFHHLRYEALIFCTCWVPDFHLSLGPILRCDGAWADATFHSDEPQERGLRHVQALLG